MKIPGTKVTGAIMAGILSMIVFTACGTSTDDEQQPVAGEDEPVAEKIDYGPATIVLTSASAWTDEAFWEVFGPIREKFPQHKFEYIRRTANTTYEALLAAGHPIDIFWDSVGGFPVPLELELRYDMTELIKKHQVDLGAIDGAMLETVKSFSDSDALYGLPVLNNTLALYYNRDLFDKFGVEYPKAGLTWEQVLELNRRLTRSEGGVHYVGLSVMLPHYFNISPISIPYADSGDKPTINSNAGFISMFQTLREMAQAPGYREAVQGLNAGSYSNSIPFRNHFAVDQTAAMFVGLANTHLTQTSHFTKFNWDVLPYPTYAEARQANPQPYPTYFGISSTSQYKDQSMEVLKYLVSEEFQLTVSESGALPVTRSNRITEAFSKKSPFADKNLKALLYPSFTIGSYTVYDAALQGIYFKNIQPYVLGEMDLNTLLRIAEEEANQAISQAKSR